MSNGPGDPAQAEEVYLRLREWMDQDGGKTPLFGICLGHQMIAKAIGGETYKMKYGNRAQNIPVCLMDSETGYITTQNHGYAVQVESLPDYWYPLFTNLNDNSNEGVYHSEKPWFSVQFHPEAAPGANDTDFLFEKFYQLVECGGSISNLLEYREKEDKVKYNRVLLLGSGGITIGQAGEFDYSGSQAIKAFKEEGLFTVLINPNVATVQTTTGIGLADKVYSVPVKPEFVEQVIEKERPDCIAIGFGGQTALNCALELQDKGVLDKYGVTVLGTEISSILKSEDRQLFKTDVVEMCGYNCAQSCTVLTLEEGMVFAEEVGYPVLVRAGFALGGLGSGFATNVDELRTLVAGIDGEIMIDKSIVGWKELEYEIVRDRYGNCIVVCTMENFDPVGVHTGESVVVAPCLTINDKLLFKMRKAAIEIADRLNIVGECNIQYAVNPVNGEFVVIELNPRLSRSSALASKATGYPLAFVAGKLALGYSLLELPNSITKDTSALYEPALDYCVVKIPRWDLDKFEHVDKRIGTAMKSIGEVMAIDLTFEQAYMKAIRMVGLESEFEKLVINGVKSNCGLDHPSPLRSLWILQHFRFGVDDRDTNITQFFIQRLCSLASYMNTVSNGGDIDSMLKQGKQLGFSDQQLAVLFKTTESEVRQMRGEKGIHPVIRRIDTVAGEFPCNTNYLYLTYGVTGNGDQVEEFNKQLLVLGSGVYRIGSSVEFDWCSVNCIRSCKEHGYSTIMLNYNPETVSTDYDMVDKLYFDELSVEIVFELWRKEKIEGVIVSVGGQQPNNIAKQLDNAGVKVLGTHPDNIDMAENRYKFSRMLIELGVDQPQWKELTELEEACHFCNQVEYPCLVRPSYVLSGAAMNVAFCDDDLKQYLGQAVAVSKDYPVVISKFIIDAKEIEVDAVAKNGYVFLMAISEHIENAGVHSGDASLVLPAQDLNETTLKAIKRSTYKIARGLDINGPFNIQFIAKDDQVKVIECNLRSSRSFPFVSKLLGHNFIEEATKVMLGTSDGTDIVVNTDVVGVKVPQFSFNRLAGADCILGVEMNSTGEVACFGENREEAFLKGMIAVGYKTPEVGDRVLISIGHIRHKMEMIDEVKLLSERYVLYGTKGTCDFYKEHGIKMERVLWGGLDERIRGGGFEFVINISMLDRPKLLYEEKSGGYLMRRAAIESGVGLITDVKVAKLFIRSIVGVLNGLVRLEVDDADVRCSYRTVRLPGLIDPHVHVREPGLVYKGGWHTESKAGMAGGFNNIFVMPNTKPAIVTLERLQLMREVAKQSWCDYGFILGGNEWNHDDLEEIMTKDPEGIVGLKLYLDETFTDSDLQFKDWTKVEEHFRRWKWDIPIICHVEHGNLLRVLALCGMYRRRTHIAHAHNGDMMRSIIAAKKQGFPVTCEVTPHHLFLNKHICSRGVKPPLSDKENENLEQYMDWIDCFATDHAPHKAEECSCPGYSGLETALGLMLRYGVDVVREKMYDAVMRIFKVQVRESWIELDIDSKWIVDGKKLFTGAGWSVFEGWEMIGKVRRVVVEGEQRFVDGEFIGKNRGQLVKTTGFEDTRNKIEVDLRSVNELVHIEKAEQEQDPEQDMIGFEVMNRTRGVEFKKQHILSSRQFSREELRTLFSRANELRKLYKKGDEVNSLHGVLLGMVFYEPSTRTHSSFVAAVKKLGGDVVDINESGSSIKKGESLEDTVRCLESYVDGLVLRGADGYCDRACSVSRKLVINAGDGVGEHPTQSLLDVYTIREERGTVNGLTVTMIGDLKHGRTVHSLTKLLCLYNVRLRFVSLPELGIPEEILKYVEKRGVEWSIHESLEEVIEKSDVLYVTRVQEERFVSKSEYEKAREGYSITPQSLVRAKQNLVILHPLPRKGEISVEVDSDPRAVYFRQMEYGLYLRMALLDLLFGKAE